uniref:Mediator of RNA polymerase II transcription subunit 23 n=1 Tax=Rhabditophanes sp. KR3021 TaxID=114890 RepID=A0AC35UA30_9BILA
MTWRFDEESKYLFKAHLPYSTENLSVQTYFQTSIFRQPRGQILLHNYNKPQTSVSIFPTIDVCKDAILQAMYLIEESTMPINDPANQYTWLHLNHFVIYTCHIGCSSFEDLTSVLKTYLTTNPYKKARGELMWLFLQFIAFKNKDMTLNIMNNIADIYRLLYTEEQSWSGSGMDIQIMVKFFAPASIWVQFQHRFRDGTVEPPSEALRIQINHFKKEIKNNQSLHDGMLIVLANSFSNNREIFENQIYSTLSKQLEADPHDEPWLLPYGFKAEGRCKAVELVSIDCFTFHARDFLFQYMRRVFHKMSKNVVTMPPMVSGEMNVTQKMPSPASIESIGPYVLSNLMYSAFEQLILKIFTWTSQSDIVKMSTEVIKHSLQESKKKDKNPRLQFYGIPEIFTSDTTGPGFNVCPEIVRIFSLNYVRSMKMTGIESASAMTAITSLNFYFPASANAYFNNGSVVYKTCEGMPEEKTKFMVDQLDQDQLADHISSEKEYLHRNPRGNTIFVVIYRALFGNSQKQMNPTFYKVLENINIKEIINSVNLFVDYLIYKWSFGIYTPDEQDKCIKILNDMVFHYQVFHFDRLFISLVMHANDDKSIETSILIIHQLVTKHEDLKQRLNYILAFSPSKQSIPSADSETFFKTMTDYYKKFPENTYPELYAKSQNEDPTLPPAGQTLHACVIEIMTTEIEPVEIIKCFIELGLHSTSKIPYEHLNAVGLLISALPKPYYDEFLELVIGFFDLEFLKDDADVELVFTNLNTEVYHYSTPKIIAHLAIAHSVLQHAPASLLTSIPDMFKSRMLDAVNNECQLFFAIRIIVIVMAKISDIKDRVKKQLEYLTLTILIYELTAKIGDKNRKPLKKEDALIDVLYNLKYAYVGDSVRDLAEQCLAKTHGSLQEKAKFIHKGVVQSNLHGKTKNLLNVVSAQDQQYLQQQPLYQTKPEEVPEYQQPSRNISFNNQMPMHNFGNTSSQIINPINAMSAMNTLSTGPLMNMGNMSGPSSNMTMMLQSPKPSPSNFDVDKSYKEQEAAKRHYEMSNPMEREKHELAIKQDHERAMHTNTMNHSRPLGRLGSRDEFLRRENEDVKNASCSFDEDTFCNWINFDDYWKTGEDVELDPIHSIMNSPTGVGKFAFIQKEPANDQPGFLVSPELNTPPESTTKVIFYYRKNTNSPILDICVTRGDITQLRCIESVSDKGPQQWILKNIRLPVQTEPFKIVFRVRNMRSIMDVVAIDDIIIETVPNNNGRMTVIKSQKGTASSNINSGLIKQIPTQQSGIEFDVQPAAVTRAVSRTTPPASRFNVGEFPSFANGVDIFIPDIGKGCKAIRCSFMKDNCFWSIGKSWKRIDANLAVELPGTDSITSGFFLVPLGSFFEFDLWMSDTATIVVYQNVEGKQNNLFNRKGGLTNNGWHRFRIPLQASFSPSSVSLQSLIGRNDFITISNVKLVNGNGEEVSCESVQTETPLETKNPYVKTDNPFTIQRDSPILTRLNGQPAVFPINNNVSPLKPIKPMKYGDFERLTSLQKATMTGENMNRPRIYPLSAVTELPNNNPQVDSNSMPDLMKLTQHIPTEWKNQFMKSLTPDDTLKPKSPFGDNEPPKQQPNMGLLLSQIGGNPVLENQLKQLAQSVNA